MELRHKLPLITTVVIVTLIMGTRFVSSVLTTDIGGVDAEIISQSATALTFVVPDGFATNRITLENPAGDAGEDEVNGLGIEVITHSTPLPASRTKK